MVNFRISGIHENLSNLIQTLYKKTILKIKLDYKKQYRYQYEELGWFGLGQGVLESSIEYGIEPPGPICHGVSIVGHIIK